MSLLTSDIEVDANGEETFWVDKKIISTFSRRLDKICNDLTSTAPPKMLKIILHDLPGGPETLEQILRFCYNRGKIDIVPANACLLNFSAHYMEMTSGVDVTPNLVQQTEWFLKGISYWTWSEILVATRQCQDHILLANSSGTLQKVVDSLVGRINSTLETSTSNSSPESSGFRVSFDTKSTLSMKNCPHRAWWFDDLVLFGAEIIEEILKRLISVKMEHGVIGRFLFYYLKTRATSCTSAAKRKIVEIVIGLLSTLDREFVSCKGLFWLLRLSLPLNLKPCLMGKLDAMIGFQLDRAVLDNILIPNPNVSDNLYDVSLVLRFLKAFLTNGGRSSITRLKRVGSLVDLYLAEVAPDPCLKIQKFVSLAMALPDSSRDSHDSLYRAIDMYIEVHSDLSEEQKMRICCVLNYEKLSCESCKHLAQNPKLPSRTAIQALVSQQHKLKNLLQDTNNHTSLQNSPCKSYNRDEQIIIYAKKLDSTTSENEKLKAHLHGMQCKVMELERMCKKMQSQVSRILKGGKLRSRRGSSLPKLCR